MYKNNYGSNCLSKLCVMFFQAADRSLSWIRNYATFISYAPLTDPVLWTFSKIKIHETIFTSPTSCTKNTYYLFYIKTFFLWYKNDFDPYCYYPQNMYRSFITCLQFRLNIKYLFLNYDNFFRKLILKISCSTFFEEACVNI